MDLPPPHILEALYRTGSRFAKASEPADVVRIYLDETSELIGADSGAVFFVNPDNGKLDIEAYAGASFDEPFDEIDPDNGLPGWVALHKKAVRCEDLREDPRHRPIRAAARGALVLPMDEHGQVVGVAIFDSDAPGKFSEEDMRTCELFTAEAARVLHDLWLIRRLKTKAAQLEAVLAAGQTLVSRLDPSEILEAIAQSALALTGCRIAAILLLEDGGNLLSPKAVAASPAPAPPHPPIPTAESSMSAAVRRLRQVEVLDLLKIEEAPAFLEMAQAHEIASFLSTPIVFEGQPLGVLNVYRAAPHRHTDEEKRVLRAVAGIGAAAIRNAELHDRVLRGEENLRRGERLAALGLLAAEIAHEIRNPLTVLKLLFQSLGFSFGDGDPRRKDVEIIDAKLDQLEGTVGRILDFARQPSELFSRFPAGEIVSDTLLLARHKLAQSNVALHLDISAEPLFINGSKSRLQQALLNLILNSLQAIEDGGKLSLRLFPERRKAVEGVALELEDTGRGIAEDMRDRVFETFLTSRPEGAGLGLAIVKRITEDHNGSVEIVRSGPSGSVIKIWIPAA